MRKTNDDRFRGYPEEYFYDYWEKDGFDTIKEPWDDDAIRCILLWDGVRNEKTECYDYQACGVGISFAAGSIKYLILAKVAMWTLLTDEQYTKFYAQKSHAQFMDIDEIIEIGERRTMASKIAKMWIIDVKNMCERIFEEDSEEEKGKLLDKIKNYFNMYFMDPVIYNIFGCMAELLIAYKFNTFTI